MSPVQTLPPAEDATQAARALLRVKVLHTLIWVVMAGAILALPVCAP